jgi:hypothetical protein
MSSLLIFAGAGASRGVSKEKYPMALDFRRRLPPEITDDLLYQRLVAHLENITSHDFIDIEHVLWELGQLITNLDYFTNRSKLAGLFLMQNWLVELTGVQLHGPQIQSQFEQLKGAAIRLQNRINERVYEFYSQLPTDDELQRSWLPLLSFATKTFDDVDIVTTNYDLVIESALMHLNTSKIDAGYSTGLYPLIDLKRWSNSSSRIGMLTKLHGSVDWKIGFGGTVAEPVVRRGHPEFDGDHSKRLILYPGFKGVPAAEPFITFHDYFKRRLSEATHVLFIGFAFRDEYINQIVSNNLNQKTKTAVINPSPELPNESFLRNSTHIKKAFGALQGSTPSTESETPVFCVEDFAHWLESSFDPHNKIS